LTGFAGNGNSWEERAAEAKASRVARDSRLPGLQETFKRLPSRPGETMQLLFTNPFLKRGSKVLRRHECKEKTSRRLLLRLVVNHLYQ
jgi:hypothetical protein